MVRQPHTETKMKSELYGMQLTLRICRFVSNYNSESYEYESDDAVAAAVHDGGLDIEQTARSNVINLNCMRNTTIILFKYFTLKVDIFVVDTGG
jgi:hypothetical protein